MRSLDKLRLRFRSLFRRGNVEQELDRELQFHLDEQIQENIAAGMSPEEARYAAMRTIGNIAQLKEDCRERRGLGLVEEFGRNLRYAGRALSKNPAFTLVAILTLALGIGATTVIFSLLYTTVLYPVSYTDADRLLILQPTVTVPQGSTNGMPWSYPKFQDVRQFTNPVMSMSGFSPVEVNITDAGEPERIRGEYVSTNYFNLLDIQPLLGRVFLPDEDETPNSPAITLISENLWRRKFGADPDVAGREIHINRIPFTIVGVIPGFFRGETNTAELWIPVSMAPTVMNVPARLTRRMSHWMSVVARLKPDVTVLQADESLKDAVRRMEEAQPSDTSGERKFSGQAIPLLDAKVDPTVRRSLAVLLTAVGFVLLITCLNLSNLLLSRSLARRTEVAIRLAIGASRWTLLRQFMTESLLLAVSGGAAGLVVAAALLELLPLLDHGGLARGGTSAFIRGVNFNAIGLQQPAILGFNFLLSVATGFLFGILPAIRASRSGSNAAIDLARNRRVTLRRTLVVAQVALAVLLLAGAGVMLRSFGNLLSIDIGMNPERLMLFQVDLPGTHYKDDAPRRFFGDLVTRIKTLPGVENVTLSSTVPLRGQNEVTMGSVDGKEAGQVAIHIVSTEYFQTFGIPLRKGRLLTDADRVTSPHVAVISESAAKRYFGDQDPIGHRITRTSSPGEEAEIVGIVGNSRYRYIEMDPDADVYVSYLQADTWLGNFITVKTAMAPESLTPAVRAEILGLDPLVPMYGVTTMNDVVANATARTRFSSVLLGIFAGLALLVAGVGVYGMLSYAVTQRTREIGIRIALGAGRPQVARLVVGDGIVLCFIGLALGLMGAFGATRLLGGLLYQTTPTDPGTFAAVAILLLAAALLACWLPARRAARVDPIVALRYE